MISSSPLSSMKLIFQPRNKISTSSKVWKRSRRTNGSFADRLFRDSKRDEGKRRKNCSSFYHSSLDDRKLIERYVIMISSSETYLIFFSSFSFSLSLSSKSYSSISNAKAFAKPFSSAYTRNTFMVASNDASIKFEALLKRILS